VALNHFITLLCKMLKTGRLRPAPRKTWTQCVGLALACLCRDRARLYLVGKGRTLVTGRLLTFKGHRLLCAQC